MNIGNIFRKALPYITALVVFYAVSAIYFAPQFQGKTLQMTDVQMYEGMKKEISDHRAEYGEDPQWTGSMFGGMPAYLITVKYPAMVIRNAAQWVMNLIGEPVALMFLAMTGFWLMLLMAGVNPWVAIPAALAYGLSTYNILIIGAGHITKMRAIGYAPMLVGAVIYTFRRNPWIGGALSALFGTLLIAASHHQITYYFLLVVAAYWINQLVVAIKEKGLGRFGKATAALIGAAVLAFGANFTHLWYTAEHTPDTTRGGSEVATATADSVEGTTGPKKSRGLDLEYATAWSYGVGESLNMFIPDFRGGGSSGGFAADGPVATALRKSGIQPSVATQLPGYWGDQPFTGGPTYIGAVMAFLFVLGMFVLPGRQKWWVLGVSLLGLLLAWGRNAMWFTELSFTILPGYNKFRTVAMALTILQWSVPFLAALVMSGMWNREFDKPRFMKGLWWSLGITGGLALFFALFGGTIYDFGAAGDGRFGEIPGLVEAMQRERAAMFSGDCWRTLIFVALTAAAAWAFTNLKNFKRWMFVGAVGALTLADLVPVDLRYLSHDSFQIKSRVQIAPSEADKTIMQDKELGFRVMNTGNPFNDAMTSYFHRSVGGYHGAKLRRYQDVIDRYLSRIDMDVLNMLDTKYFIVTDPDTGKQSVQVNPEANGPAWFVDRVFLVGSAQEELDALGTIDNKHEAVVDRRFTGIDKRYPAALADMPFTADSAATIRMTDYRANYLRYETSSTEEQPAVFSEIYYDKGWKAYVDGVEVPYFRADYILRGLVVPAGDHIVEWKFRAPRFAAVEGVTLACSILILLWLAAAIVLERRNKSTMVNG